MLSALRAYNASSQLISSTKGTYVEIPNAGLVMQVGMVNPFQLNSMKTRIKTRNFPSAKPQALFCSMGAAV